MYYFNKIPTFYISDCDHGNFRNSTSNECVPCPIGSYIDTVNAITCIACPSGYTTSNKGSNQSGQCTGKEGVLNLSEHLKKSKIYCVSYMMIMVFIYFNMTYYFSFNLFIFSVIYGCEYFTFFILNIKWCYILLFSLPSPL